MIAINSYTPNFQDYFDLSSVTLQRQPQPCKYSITNDRLHTLCWVSGPRLAGQTLSELASTT